ncbi:uncharacterized protein LOC131036977 [Cryptomeria japonica]|uniref:uncharacterized protein LOC131036977 n=1 Tax=Cryptomeria japonica TaxID=3369 RepID=UPI0025AD0087|nr:uncharacterized protein LOC131036977 [Cryptomeria japonica]
MAKSPRDYAHWTLPSSGWVKVNFDGASKENSGLTGCGGVIRDKNGRFLAMVALPLGCQTNHLVEVIVAYQGLLLAKINTAKSVWLEGDSNNIIQCLLGNHKPSWNIKWWIEKARMFKWAFHEIKDINMKIQAISNKRDSQATEHQMVDQRKAIVDSMQKIVGTISDMKKEYDYRISQLEEKLKKDFEGRLSNMENKY